MRVAVWAGIIDRGKPKSIVRFTKCLIEYLSKSNLRSFALSIVHRKENSFKYPYKQVEKLTVPPFPFVDNAFYLVGSLGRRVLLPRPTLDSLILRKCHFDVIHYPSLGWCGSPALFSHFSSAKIVATLHGIAPLVISPKVYFGEKKSLAVCTAFLKLLHKKITLLVVVSESEKREIVRYLRFPSEKVRVIHHGVEEKFKVMTEPDIRETLERKYGVASPFILHVSHCNPRKNVLRLLKAFYRVRKLGVKHNLVIVGPKSTVERILNQLKDLGSVLQRTLRVLSDIPDEDLIKLYNAADVFVFPSLHENFGMPVVEAMACGCPVITSNVYALPEIAGDAAILVDPYDVGALSTAMFELLTDQALHETLSKKGLARAKMFSWKKCAEKYIKVYEKACNM